MTAKKRRAKGDGSLYQTMHNDRMEFCAAWWGEDKKLHRTYGLTETEALVKKQKLISKLALPDEEKPKPKRTTLGTPSNPTVEQFMERWLSNRKTLSEVVRRQYRQNITNHVLPIIGKKAIRRLSDVDITAVMDSMEAKQLGKAATAHTLKQLNTMLNYAVKMKFLKRNPTEFVDLPAVRPAVRHEDNEMIEWRTQTLLNILDELRDPKNPHHDSYTRIAMTALGIRGSELVGLTWDCFDLQEKTLTIRQQMKKEHGGEYYIDMQTKNRRERTIPLYGMFLDAMVEEMKKGRKQSEPMRTSDGKEITNLVFLHPSGKPIVYHWHFNDWQKILMDYFLSEGRTEEQAKALSWRPHYNRHIAASILAKDRIPLMTAQQILGHLDKEMTEWYTHAYREDVQAAAKALADTVGADPWAFAKK